MDFPSANHVYSPADVLFNGTERQAADDGPETCGWPRRQQSNAWSRSDFRIGVFTGSGSSHSWLWFVDTFERMGFHGLRFLTSVDIDDGGLLDCDVLAVSGGDTFAIAEGLGPSGARRIRTFIEGGGLYIGSCAGAYLVMNSSKPHLNLFNFAAVKITNLSKMLPECRGLPHKFSICYGCDYIFHPVRGSVALEMTGVWPFGRKGQRLLAPLYGGPGMTAADNGQVLARYADFTAKTRFLVHRDIARTTLMGHAAVVRTRRGKGVLYLLGPHFEHPRFPAANEWVARAVLCDAPHCDTGGSRQPVAEKNAGAARAESAGWIRDLKRELSNSRIVAVGLEMRPVRWRIGTKYYEPEKIRIFIESLWKRLPLWEKNGAPACSAAAAGRLLQYAAETTVLLRRLKRELDHGGETRLLAETVFDLLQRFATAFLRCHFRSRSLPRASLHER